MSRYTRTVYARNNEHIYVKRRRPSPQTYSGDDPLFGIIGFLLLASFGLWLLSIIWPLLLIGGIIYLVGKNWAVLSKHVFIPSLRFTGQVLLLTAIAIKIISIQVWRGTSRGYQICRDKYRRMRSNQGESRTVGAAANTEKSDSGKLNTAEVGLLPPNNNLKDDAGAGEWELIETQVPDRIAWR